MSSKIPFQGLNNTRDLGGMRTADGREILSGKLYRSGHLYAASIQDRARLSEAVELVIDLRTERERNEKPDPVIPGVKNLPLPIIESLAAGVSRDAESDEAAFIMAAADPDRARAYMSRTYTDFIRSDFSVSQYRRFVQLLRDPRKKAVLWHCTAGKDRAGFAAVLVQELLGVSRSDILEDYLQTNVFLAEEVEQLYAMLGARMNGLDERREKALYYLFTTQEEYLAAVYTAIEERFGSIESFAERGLGMGAAEREQFRAQYLREA